MEGQKARDDNSTVKRIGALEKRCSATEERCSAAEERVLSTEAMAQKYASLEEIIAKQSNQIANQSNQINSLNDKYEKGCTAAEEKRLTLEVIIAKQSNQLKILNDMYKQMEGRLQNPAHGIIGIEYKKKKRSSSPSEIYQASVTGVKNKKNRSASSSFKTLSWKDQLVQPIPMKKRKRTMLCNNKGLSDNDSTDADDDLYHSSFASDGFDSSIIGRIIRVNEENQLCLVAGECKTNQGKEHKIWYLNERRSLIVKLTRDNCSILEDHELPWMPRGLLGKQLSLVWNGVYEGAAPISFGSFVVQDLGGGIYTMLYSVNDTRVANKYGGDDGVPTRKKESSDDPVWERIDINIQKTIDWSRKMIARRAPSRAVRNKSIQIGDIINLKWPDDGKYYQALVMGITHVTSSKTEHTLMFYFDRSTYTTDLNKNRWEFVDEHELPNGSDSCIGRQLAVVDGGKEIRFECFVADDLGDDLFRFYYGINKVADTPIGEEDERVRLWKTFDMKIKPSN